MNKKDELAKLGEDIATKYLIENEYKIICRNWTKNHLEIDIIAEKNNNLIIVEVKTRNSDVFGSPQDFIGVKKQTNLVRAAQLYVDINCIDMEIQFDVIAIIINEKQKQIEHIPNAFSPLIGM